MLYITYKFEVLCNNSISSINCELIVSKKACGIYKGTVVTEQLHKLGNKYSHSLHFYEDHDSDFKLNCQLQDEI